MNVIEKKYKKYDPIEHILKRPGMYVGSIDTTSSPMWILNDEKTHINEKTIEFIPGLYKIFDEIIVNAYDQTIQDPTVTVIKVNIEKKDGSIMVYNNGRGIDVVIHPKEKMYVPELIFGELLTSTHFDDTEKRITGGLHGLGAKLTNILSSSFVVEVGDIVNNKSFHQKYTDNLSKRTKPKVKLYNKKDGYVRITFIPDFKYFKIDGFSDDMIKLMQRRVFDLAMLVGKKTKIYLNDELIRTNEMTSYMKMITNEPIIIEQCNNPESLDRWRIGLSKSSDGYRCISFVNGVNTWNGGTHVKYIESKILKGLKHRIEKKYKDVLIKDQHLKDVMMIVITATIENPGFSSQSKEELITPEKNYGSFCEIDKKVIKKLYNLLDIDTLVERLESKVVIKTTVTHKIKNIPKLYDAYWAGTKRSIDCSLILTEGDSAKATAIAGIAALNDTKKNVRGSDLYGIFPLKGKLLNTREATKKQIAENEEFINLQKIIGLEIGKEYNEDNVKDLRYGKSIILFMDQDLDGFHIKGLFINMIDYFWPSLLKIPGFLKMFITPIIKTTKNNETYEFFSLSAYDKWRLDKQNYQVKYYKGLGTNTTEEARGYFRNIKKYLIDIVHDAKSSDSINLAFNRDMANDRKIWLKNYDPDDVPDFTKKSITHSDFINKELIHFSNHDNIRSVASLMDGLKPSQRKVLFSAFKRRLTNDIKVAQLTGYVSEQTAYHHGEVSLSKTIIAMAQNFVGSNNINLLVPSGQFGTRLMPNGLDAASPRYIFTRLEEITRLIFDQRDDQLLDFLEEDNQTIEPKFYVPIIPMVLVNGCRGIGTGYSTDIPNFSPLDIIEVLLNKLNGRKSSQIHPWYLDFKGRIKKITNESYEVFGNFELNQKLATLRITELPIGHWTENYKTFLEDDALKDIVSKVKNNCDDTTIDFIIKLKTLPNESEINKIFQLSSKINLGNMYLYDRDGGLKKYTVDGIVDEFFVVRLEFYEKRKTSLLKGLKDEIDDLEKKLKFVKYVVANNNVFRITRDRLIDQLVREKILDSEHDPMIEVYFGMHFQSFTKEKVLHIETRIIELKKEYDVIKKKSKEDMWKEDLNRLKEYLVSIK